MRASVLSPGRQLTVETRAVPRPSPGDVLVQVSAVGICGSDTHYLRHGRIGEHVVREPLILGHEAAGVIVDVGAGVQSSRIGQRVSIEPQRPDPTSTETMRGDYHLCPAMRFYGTPPVDGALTEFVTIGSAFAHAVPDDVSDEAAALFEPLSVGLASIAKASVRLGDSLLISGAGPIGLMCAQVARAAGLSRIVVTEPDEQRRSQALRFGATDVAVPGTVIAPVDAFVDASGAPAAVTAGISALRPGGRAVLVGMGADTMELPISLIQNREIVLTGVFRYANTWPTATRLATTGAVDLDSMVTARFGLDELPAALNADHITGHIKAVVYPALSRYTEPRPDTRKAHS
ncbi:NAD(P)-dependent alcohol dehydrogenase [Gordonia sp. 852002-10350_SCH5691597]|uniref:NAD(P)-dependent alcohol dehydrogenase n=1 Tax=Gordonia sp. 852002-10350_SCH5691597 TaxID=1834085 RepID=UPI0007EBD25E|nr:NAD(P)-dependent alcohol dehydrogenase [Gordonia sp. 852002-10350_SCH5691597]OBA58244.1 sorbitol dehydrogenase [Gordonia sp. 852002-10350_SCH5691597]